MVDNLQGAQAVACPRRRVAGDGVFGQALELLNELMTFFCWQGGGLRESQAAEQVVHFQGTGALEGDVNLVPDLGGYFCGD